MRQRLILIRHYFPGVDIGTLDDERFAELSGDAEWMHSQQMLLQMNVLGAAIGQGGKAK